MGRPRGWRLSWDGRLDGPAPRGLGGCRGVAAGMARPRGQQAVLWL